MNPSSPSFLPRIRYHSVSQFYFLYADPLQNVDRKHKRKSPREIRAFPDPYRRAGERWQNDHSPEDV
jgi:hypothetical protein